MEDLGQPSVRITLDMIYSQVQTTANEVIELKKAVNDFVVIGKRLDDHDDKFDIKEERLRKLEAQIASQWIVTSIMVVALGATAGRLLFG